MAVRNLTQLVYFLGRLMAGEALPTPPIIRGRPSPAPRGKTRCHGANEKDFLGYRLYMWCKQE